VKRPLVALSLATAFGVGYVPFAPGTFGSAVGLIIWALLPASNVVHAAVIVIIFAVGAWSATAAERYFGGTDPGPVVIDEVMGMLLTLFMHPVGWAGAIGAFFLFRAFDVIKPYPADKLEQLHGGLGIMADDGMAAVYANVVLWGILSAIGWLSS
jgi:phosphatidylglycerophosphatase A